MLQLVLQTIPYFLALAGGAAAAWFLATIRMRQQAQTTIAAIELDRALLSQRIQQLDNEIDSLKAAITVKDQEASSVRTELKAEAEHRLTLERELGRIPDLETSLKSRTAESAHLQNKLVAEIAKQSELVAQLDQERKSAEEKLK